MAACNEFNRAKLLRDGAAAVAGRGLPAIERGMPAPAGTGLTRRAVLLRGLGGVAAVYGAQRMMPQAFEAGIAAAQETAGSQRVLVSIFMDGGVDSLSVLAPTGDSRYASLRPTLALAPNAGQAFSEDTRLRWAPSVSGLRTLHSEGKVSVMPAVGYTHPDQSHFTSRHFWEVGATDIGGRWGWLGRYLDRHGVADNPLQGLALNWSLSPALAASRVPVAAVPYPDDFGLWTPGVGDPILGPTYAAIGTLGGLPTEDQARLNARLVASQVDHIRRDLSPYQGTTSAPVAYPNTSFGRRLRTLAAMLAGGVPVRVATLVAPGGYDTHSNQAATLADDLSETATAVLAFQRDLEARGLADRVLTHLWSEFGRRPEQNDTGTDHGAAGVGFLIGTRARGTQIGEFPGLATLDAQDNLRATSDFRGVYCALLEQWFGVDAAPLIPDAASFTRPQILKS